MSGSWDWRNSTFSQENTVPIDSGPIFTPWTLLVVSVTIEPSRVALVLVLSLEADSNLKSLLRYRPHVADDAPEVGEAHSALDSGPLGNVVTSALTGLRFSGLAAAALPGLW